MVTKRRAETGTRWHSKRLKLHKTYFMFLETSMTSMTSKSAVKAIAASLIAVSLLSGCANMSKRQQNTAIGAAAGAVLGSVLTGGDAIGTVGGAAVGGVVGNQTGKR